MIKSLSKLKILSHCYRLLWIVLAIAGISAVAFYLLGQIFDPDFFWHLKTGEWIWQHKALPVTDPFSINPPSIPTLHQKFILNSYWLSQLIMFACYAIAGWPGIIILRFLLAGLVILILARRCDFRDIGVVALLILVAIQFLEEYTLDRPQLMSFVCFTLLILMIDRFTENRSEQPHPAIFVSALSLLMLVWANLHGGYFVGQLVLVLVVITEGIKFFHPSLCPMSRHRYKNLLIAVTAALLFSLINPNIISGIREMFFVISSNSFTASINKEYFSLLQKWRDTGSPTVFISCFIALLVIFAAGRSYKSLDITTLAILACTGFFGYMHVRYFPFFMAAALPFIAQRLGSGIYGFVSRTVIILAAIGSLYFFAVEKTWNRHNLYRQSWVSAKSFPVAAADFMAERHVRGGVFSSYHWGGYLIWKLGPDAKLFTDSRNMDLKRFFELKYCEDMGLENNEHDLYWQKLFDTYDISYAVLERINSYGQPHALATSMQRNRDWAMIFAKDNTAVFARR